MRDPAGQHANAGDPLSMKELVLQTLLLRDVPPNRQKTGRGEPAGVLPGIR